MVDKVVYIVTLLGHWGYLVFFLAAFLESAAFMGLIVPGESMVILAGVIASQGYLDIGDCVAVVSLGAVLGDSAGYALGAVLGRGYFERHGRLLFIRQKHVEKTEEYFRLHGGKTVFFGRFIGIFRAMAPFVAGMSRMRYGRFFAFNVAGGVAWSATFVLLGYFFGHSWKLIETWTGRAGMFVLFVALVAAGLFHLYRKAVRRQADIYAWFASRYHAVVSRPPVAGFSLRHPALAAFVTRRLSPGSYLGLHLTVGLALIVALLWAFGLLTASIFAERHLAAVDGWVGARAQYFKAPLVTRLLALAVYAGGGAVMLSAVAVAVVFLAVLKRFAYLAGLLTSVSGAVVLATVLRAALLTVRPAAPAAGPAGVWMLPGDPVMTTVVFYGMLAYFLSRESASWKAGVSAAVFTLFAAFLVMMATVYFGIHLFSGAMAEFVGGLLWLSVCVTGIDAYMRRGGRKRPGGG